MHPFMAGNSASLSSGGLNGDNSAPKISDLDVLLKTQQIAVAAQSAVLPVQPPQDASQPVTPARDQAQSYVDHHPASPEDERPGLAGSFVAMRCLRCDGLHWTESCAREANCLAFVRGMCVRTEDSCCYSHVTIPFHSKMDEEKFREMIRTIILSRKSGRGGRRRQTESNGIDQRQPPEQAQSRPSQPDEVKSQKYERVVKDDIQEFGNGNNGNNNFGKFPPTINMHGGGGGRNRRQRSDRGRQQSSRYDDAQRRGPPPSSGAQFADFNAFLEFQKARGR
jgi:hypothetical protein